MKLFYSPTSPYARKVRVVAREHGLLEGVEEIVANSMEEGAADKIHNPLSKVPCLITNNGAPIYDSPVICEYLDDIGTGAELVPKTRASYFDCRRREALGDGVLDAAFQTVMETRRPDAEPSKHWLGRWKSAIDRALVQMVSDIHEDRFDLGDITFVCALGYLNFRLPETNWEARHPELADWYKRHAARPSVVETKPPAA